MNGGFDKALPGTYERLKVEKGIIQQWRDLPFKTLDMAEPEKDIEGSFLKFLYIIGITSKKEILWFDSPNEMISFKFEHSLKKATWESRFISIINWYLNQGFVKIDIGKYPYPFVTTLHPWYVDNFNTSNYINLSLAALTPQYLDIFKHARLYINTMMNIWDYRIYENIILMIRLPSVIKTNTQNQYHCDGDSAVRFGDRKQESYFLNGVNVPAKIALLDESDPYLIDAYFQEGNVEIRKQILNKVGISRLFSKTKHKIIDSKVFNDLSYTLMVIRPFNRDRIYLKMENPSLEGVVHIEAVSPDCRTIEKALEFRNGTKELPKIIT